MGRVDVKFKTWESTNARQKRLSLYGDGIPLFL